MRFTRFNGPRGTGLALVNGDGSATGLYEDDPRFPGTLSALIKRGGDALQVAAHAFIEGEAIDLSEVERLPPLPNPSKIICVGLNYADHSAESGYKLPDYPTLFARFPSSLIGHGAPILRPNISEQLDYEGELVAVIGKRGRAIPKQDALAHVVGYSVFNDGSVRDYQHRTPQWTVGKNFDDTGAFGPDFVTADELPEGGRGLRIETRLNGEVVQSATTADLVFDVATLVSTISEVCTLLPGDVIVTGTPSGIGAARKPPLWMKPGDICEVEIERVGLLRNPIAQEQDATTREDKSPWAVV